MDTEQESAELSSPRRRRFRLSIKIGVVLLFAGLLFGFFYSSEPLQLAEVMDNKKYRRIPFRSSGKMERAERLQSRFFSVMKSFPKQKYSSSWTMDIRLQNVASLYNTWTISDVYVDRSIANVVIPSFSVTNRTPWGVAHSIEDYLGEHGVTVVKLENGSRVFMPKESGPAEEVSR